MRVYLVAMMTDTYGDEGLLGCYDDRHLRRWGPTWLLWRQTPMEMRFYLVAMTTADHLLRSSSGRSVCCVQVLECSHGTARPDTTYKYTVNGYLDACNNCGSIGCRISKLQTVMSSYQNMQLLWMKGCTAETSHTPKKSQQLLPHWQCNTNRTIFKVPKSCGILAERFRTTQGLGTVKSTERFGPSTDRWTRHTKTYIFTWMIKLQTDFTLVWRKLDFKILVR